MFEFFLAQQEAGAGGLILLTAGILLAATYLLRPKTAKPEFDDRPGQLANRGDSINYVLGRRLVSMQPVLVYDRKTKQESVGSGGKKGVFGGGAASTSQTVYTESGVHVICLGPASALYKILKTEEVIWEGKITPDDTPSGTELQDLEGNRFVIYWGEKNQPPNTELEVPLGYVGRHKNICYVHWLNNRLGPSAVWGQYDYDIECKCIAKFPLEGSDCNVPAKTDLDSGGQNMAHMLHQLITGTYPHGVGMENEYNGQSLIDLGKLIEQESLPQNIVILNDRGVAEAIDELLTDASVMLAEEQGVLQFLPFRSTTTATVVTEKYIETPSTKHEVNQGDFLDDRIIFLYPGMENNYRGSDISTEDDSTARAFKQKTTRNVPMPTITNSVTAALVAERRRPFFLSLQGQSTLKLGRTMKRLIPGQIVEIPVVGRSIVTKVKRNLKSGNSNVTLSPDVFTPPDSGWQPDVPAAGGSTSTSTPDTLVRVVEAGRRYAGQSLGFHVLRGRENADGGEASVHVSTDGTTYTLEGYQNYIAALGEVAEDFVRSPIHEAPFRRVSDSGPLISHNAANAARLLDLSANDTDWYSDRQVTLFKNEIMSIQSFTNEGSGEYRANGTIREALHSHREFLYADTETKTLTFEPENLYVFSRSDWTPGQTIYVKVVPYGVSIDTVDPIELTFTGKALGALPVANLSPEAWTLPSNDNEDITFEWDPRINRGQGAGSGELAVGQAVPESVSNEGTFIVRIVDVSGYVIEEYDAGTSTSWVYTAAEQQSHGFGPYDLLYEPKDFEIEVVHTLNGTQAYPVRRRVYYQEED